MSTAQVCNPVTARITRAKSVNTTAVPTTVTDRRRAALEDLSNVNKTSATGSAKLLLAKTKTKESTLTSIKARKPTNGTATTTTTTTKPTINNNTSNENTASTTAQKPSSALTTASKATRKLLQPVNAKSSTTTTKTATEDRKPKLQTIELKPKSQPLELKSKSQSIELKPSVSTARPSLKRRAEDDEENDENEPPVKTTATSKDTVEKDVHVAKRSRTVLWDDLDTEDLDDPLMVAEYADDIFDYLYELEPKYMPNPNYMDDQNELEWHQRGVLLDWLVEVHAKLHLLPETLFLATNIIDRFMTLRVVNLDKIQLVGVTALLLAAKYEEVFPPALNHFAYLTGGNFDESDILGAEKFMLQILEFEMSYPNPLNFLRRISKADNYDVQSRSFGKYFLEIAIIDHHMISYPPSVHAAMSMYIARTILKRPEWDANLVHYSGDYSEKTVRKVAKHLVRYLASPVEHEALFKKYASKRYFKASLIARQWAKANWRSFLSDDEKKETTTSTA
ncbi:hypothetical protein DV451_003553 [Geotrichum candidum]|uniref:Cyclin N-terminal domain-containing protein n=1 Tax=Geotrichum candidum TaxID=1173061 RepID=A0A9P5G3R0_GEOCN|nr:hypothetical protein DV451_003553 [Geotrichum candidum]